MPLPQRAPSQKYSHTERVASKEKVGSKAKKLEAQNKIKQDSRAKLLAVGPGNARKVLTNFIKILDKNQIGENKNEVSKFLKQNYSPRFIKEIQKMLVKAGISLSFQKNGQTISGMAACDGSWGKGSQNSLEKFKRMISSEKKAQKNNLAKSERFNQNIKIHESLLTRIISKELQKNLPLNLHPGSKKFKKIINILAQINNDQERGLTHVKFFLKGDLAENQRILSAIKILAKTISSQGDYSATATNLTSSSGKIILKLGKKEIDLNLWGKNIGSTETLKPVIKKVAIHWRQRAQFDRGQDKIKDLLYSEVQPALTMLKGMAKYFRSEKSKAMFLNKVSALDNNLQQLRDFKRGRTVDVYNLKGVKDANKEVRTGIYSLLKKEDLLMPVNLLSLQKLNKSSSNLHQMAKRSNHPKKATAPETLYKKAMKLGKMEPDFFTRMSQNN